MYCDLLDESVRELKHIEIPPAKRIFIDLKVDAFIPTDYVTDDKQRIALYRRMNSLNDMGELDDMKEEMVDRFGSIPRELEALFNVIELKINAGEKGVTSLTGGSEAVEIKFELKKTLVIKTKGLPKDKWFDIVRDRIRRLPG
jgi:transcription-repair coupling factor (superfamily II helicase)